jgi:hypothetical protein
MRSDDIAWYEMSLQDMNGCIDFMLRVAILYQQNDTCDADKMASLVSIFNTLLSGTILRIQATSVEASFARNGELNDAYREIRKEIQKIPLDSCAQVETPSQIASAFDRKLQNIVDSFLYLPQLYSSACREKKTRPACPKTFALFFERPRSLVRRIDLSRRMRRLGTLVVSFGQTTSVQDTDHKNRLLLGGKDEESKETFFLVHRDDRSAEAFVSCGFVDDGALDKRLWLLVPGAD